MRSCKTCGHWNRERDFNSWGHCESPIMGILKGAEFCTDSSYYCKEWKVIGSEKPMMSEEEKLRLKVLRCVKNNPEAATEVIIAALNPRVSASVRDHEAAYHLHNSMIFLLDSEENHNDK